MTHPLHPTDRALPLNRRQWLAGTALLAMQTQAGARAADWPDRPIKLIVSGPPGSGADIFARLIAVPLQEGLKQAVVVDNRAGANGLIGNDAVAKSAGDGYTLLLTPSSSIAINPILQARMPYDTQKDLLPVAQVCRQWVDQEVLVCAPKLVLTVGKGTHGFTLDRESGNFILTHPNLSIPEDTSEFAINTSNARFWEPPVHRYVTECQAGRAGAPAGQGDLGHEAAGRPAVRPRCIS